MTVRLFAGLREYAGVSRVRLEIADGASVTTVASALWSSLDLAEPAFTDTIAVAINGEYVDVDRPLRDGDELALIPPVCGGAPTEPAAGVLRARVTSEPISRETLADLVAHPSAGAVVTFAGLPRDVPQLDYEAHESMASRRIAEILEEVVEQHAATAAAAEHRIGEVPWPEAAVVVAVSAPHRHAAFSAARDALDRIKAEAPIWKQEVDGDRRQRVGGTIPTVDGRPVRTLRPLAGGSEASPVVAPGTAVPLPDAESAALDLAAQYLPSIDHVELRAAAVRVVAEDVVSGEAHPPFDVSAMDGYAVRASEVGPASQRPPTLVDDEARAGAAAEEPLARGTAVRISTGARVPEGADAVVRREDAELTGGVLRTRVAAQPGADIRRGGEDVRRGDVLVRPGDLLTPGRLGLLAGVGVRAVGVRARPSVSIVVTGDEVAPHGSDPSRDGVHDVHSVLLPALFASAGSSAVDVHHVGDDAAATREALRQASGDVLVTCGGISAGAHDHVRGALATMGATEVVGRIAMRPGGPTWIGSRSISGRQLPVFGLPGNPGAAMVSAALFVVPVLRSMAGHRPHPDVWGTLDQDVPRDARRHIVLWTALARTGSGALLVRPLASQGSHRLVPAATADAIAVIPPGSGTALRGTSIRVVRMPTEHGFDATR